MNRYLTIVIVAAAMLSMIIGNTGQVFAQNITDTRDNDDDCFRSNADFCGGAAYIPNPNKNKDNKGVYACNVITDSDKFCKKNLEKNIQKEKDNNKQSSGIGKITVGYGDVGSYYGKGKIVIKNLDTGKTLVTHDLNFAKQHHNQGDNCCVKVYTFDKSGTHEGDEIFAKVTGGGGSWESGTYNYTKNLKMTIDLDEIGE
jgi:hypothetical protein